MDRTGRFFPILACCHKQVAAQFVSDSVGTQEDTGLRVEENHNPESGENEWRHERCPVNLTDSHYCVQIDRLATSASWTTPQPIPVTVDLPIRAGGTVCVLTRKQARRLLHKLAAEKNALSTPLALALRRIGAGTAWAP